MGEPTSSNIYKGLALFTPGGDLVYCIDPSKKGHWHVQLCRALQQVLELEAPPFFLTDYFTATVDHWLDPVTQSVTSVAEAHGRVWRYRSVLQSIFNVPSHLWRLKPSSDDTLLADFREQFPELWQPHNLLLNLDQVTDFRKDQSLEVPLSGYVLRLFVNEQSNSTIQALENLQQFLDHTLQCAYTLRVIDVQTHPDLAEDNLITATPTLIKLWPPPTRRLVGTLMHPDNIYRLLENF